MRLNRGKIFYWFFPPLILAVIVLFFSSCLSGGIIFVEQPFSSIGTSLNKIWTQLFNKNPDSDACSNFDSEILAALAVDQSEFASLKIENENLRQQLGFFQRQSFQYVTASIISRSISPTDAIFILDRGSDDGLRQGLAVVVADGHLIGKIISVSTKTSVVQPILGRGAGTAVSLLGATRTIGLSEGTGSSLLALNFIPQDETVAVNNLVVTSGLEEMIPSGLVIGVITSVEKDPAAPFQNATVEPLVDVRQFNEVSVIVIDLGL